MATESVTLPELRPMPVLLRSCNNSVSASPGAGVDKAASGAAFGRPMGGLRPLSFDRTPIGSPAALWPATPTPNAWSQPVAFPLGIDACMPCYVAAAQAMPCVSEVPPPMPPMQPVQAMPVVGDRQPPSAVPDLAVMAQMEAYFQAMNHRDSFVLRSPAPVWTDAPIPHPPAQVVPAGQGDPVPGLSEPVGSSGLSTGPSVSDGSSLHDGVGSCRPCAWYWKPRGCSVGKACDYCHMCLDGELKKRKKAKVAALRAAGV